jgi:hypothetical protein
VKAASLATVAVIALCVPARAGEYEDLMAAATACGKHLLEFGQTEADNAKRLDALNNLERPSSYQPGYEGCAQIDVALGVAIHARRDARDKRHEAAEKNAIAKALKEIWQ